MLILKNFESIALSTFMMRMRLHKHSALMFIICAGGSILVSKSMFMQMLTITYA